MSDFLASAPTASRGPGLRVLALPRALPPWSEPPALRFAEEKAVLSLTASSFFPYKNVTVHRQGHRVKHLLVKAPSI